MKYEFKIVQSVYADPDKNGKTKLIKRDLITREMYYTEDLEGPIEAYTRQGKVCKDRCLIRHKDIGFRTVKMKYEEVKDILKDRIIIKGFKG